MRLFWKRVYWRLRNTYYGAEYLLVFWGIGIVCGIILAIMAGGML